MMHVLKNYYVKSSYVSAELWHWNNYGNYVDDQKN